VEEVAAEVSQRHLGRVMETVLGRTRGIEMGPETQLANETDTEQAKQHASVIESALVVLVRPPVSGFDNGLVVLAKQLVNGIDSVLAAAQVK
jgi:hypothetical protein